MTSERRLTLISRLALVAASLAAAVWTICYWRTGSVPAIVDGGVLKLPFAISRWWDVPMAAIWAALIVLAMTSRFIEDERVRRILIIGLLFGLFCGLFINLPITEVLNQLYGQDYDLIFIEPLVGLVAGLACGLIVSLNVGLFVGLFASMASCLVYGLGLGLVYGLVPGLVYGLVYGLLASLIVSLVYGLVTLARSGIWRHLGRWLLAADKQNHTSSKI
ncbi:MAG: hypothetical protein WCT10_03870 [Patescibacteria group bacterium]